MVEFSEMKFLMTPLFYYSGNSLDVSERLNDRIDSAQFMMATKTIL